MTGDSKNIYSKPFEIYQHASLGGPITVQFKLEGGKPVMLGDGTYGAVYEGLGQQRNLAIKVLYDNAHMRPRRLSDIDLDFDTVKKQINDDQLDVEQILVLIKNHNGPDFTLLETIRNSYKSDEEVINNETWAELAPKFRKLLQKLTDLVNSSAVYRFESEYKATKYLQDSNQRRGFNREITGIVEVWGRNEEFTTLLEENGALHDLREHFEGIDQSIKYSNYVLVMNKYNFSLKDLLERPYSNLFPRATVVDKDHATANQTGYEVLRTLPHDFRARETLMILKDATHGLYLLHNVDYHEPFFHLDIKPGNIMIKMRDNQKFDVALADLGNLPLINQPPRTNESIMPVKQKEALEPINMGTAAAPPGHDYAPGTHHYRSPEQKYYMDVANVQVVHGTLEGILSSGANPDGSEFRSDQLSGNVENIEEQLDKEHETVSEETNNKPSELLQTDQSKIANTDGSNRVILVVEDPKFENTLIEPGDVIIFSKDTQRRPFVIDRTRSINNGTSILYTLSVDLARNKSLVLAQVEKTQVEFYKKQKYRTDLFGIGAVAFDIMTAGRSPEKFYESIRKFESLSIDEIIKQYETLSRGEIEGENPDLAEIFSPFRDENNAQRYPDKDIIEFILKCMLYQSKGTFYDENKGEPIEASKAVEDGVERLLEDYKSNLQQSIIRTDESILIHRPVSINIEKAENIKLLSHEISKLQGLSPWKETADTNDAAIIAANRLLYGCFYLLRIYEFIRKKVSPGAEPPPPYFQQILPSYITLKKEGIAFQLDFDSAPIRQTRDDFLIRELRDNLLDQVLRSPSNPFIPNMFARTRRKIRLVAHPQKQNSDSDKIRFTYRFRDAAVIHSHVSPGDWIVRGNSLWEITSPVTENELILYNKEYETGDPFDSSENKYFDCTYFSAVDPLKYYLEMFGVYLYHLIFAYSPLTNATRDRIDLRALLKAFEISDTIYIQEPVKPTEKKDRFVNELEYLLLCYVHLFLKLHLHESEDSFYKQVVRDSGNDQSSNLDKETNGFNMKPIMDYAENLYKNVQRLMGDKGGLFDYPQHSVKQLENMPVKLMLDELIETPFDIEISIKRHGLIAYE